MRISDGSSDVCSSDLIALPKRRPTTFRPSLPCDWTIRCQSTGEQVIMSEACGLRASAADKPRAALLRRPRPRSEERRVGKGGGSTVKRRGSPFTSKTYTQRIRGTYIGIPKIHV